MNGSPAGRPAPALSGGQANPAPPRRRERSQLPVELEPVRRRDLRRPEWVGLPQDLPSRHGGRDDPRYRSRRFRKFLSFVIDLIVHLSVGILVASSLVKGHPGDPQVGRFLLVSLLAFIAASIVNRVLVQWAGQATVGKALVGLRMIRDDTGGRPALWMLIKAWLFGALMIIASAF